MQIKSLFVGKLQHQTVMVTRNDYSENAFFRKFLRLDVVKRDNLRKDTLLLTLNSKASKYGRTFVNFVGEAKLANCNCYA